MTETTSYIVTGTTIRQGGKNFPPGRTIELDVEDAARLKEFLIPSDEETGAGAADLNTAVDQWETLRAEMQTTIDQLNSQLAGRESDLDELTAEKEQLAATNVTLREENTQLASRVAELHELLANTPKTPAAAPAAEAKKQGGKK